MARLGWVALGLSLAAHAGACGYPDFQFTSGGGGMGVACQPLHDKTDCSAHQRCTVVDENKGTMGCVPLAATPEGSHDACADDSACPAGTWCDGRTMVCSPFCDGAASCNGSCVSALNAKFKAVPGVTVCTAHCDPANPLSCGLKATCDYDATAIDFDCFQWGGKSGGDACKYVGDCAPGYVCGGTCVAWCHPAGSASLDCLGGPCQQFSNAAPKYNGDIYGYCQ